MIISRLLGATMLSAALALSACSPLNPNKSGEEGSAAEPHGFIDGAEELSEPHSAIAYTTRGARTLHLLDLTTTATTDLTLTHPVETLIEDGRFLYTTDGDRTLEITDAGVWTVDHTDHVHYYRASARTLGTLTLAAKITTIAGNDAHTTITTAGGRLTVLDRRALETGTITELPAGAFQAPCETPGESVVLRGGTLTACQDHWVRVKHTTTGSEAEVLRGPGGKVPSSPFGSRPRSNEAAQFDSTGIWSLNAPKATVQHVPAANLIAAASPADGKSVLALDRSGTLRSYDLKTGDVLAEAKVPGTSLTLDINRAYVADPDARVIHEIDYRDNLRTARTLTVEQRPDLAVEVGR
ncbi:hypothetical protein FB565_008894 [Actinoplanes lutulentus]|uniref:Lipoprotein n=1 Tax=Actinoplanes lutulentus TaxID=1287878 RepID=A0A327Z7X3_9ACTN|nr:hypothetical protein [Actinoplanes lutulentus]MBB2949089.1 hypothetical protein [Actinoplanes lutulentus]RAK31410.1 hypothetical protein B0I29_115217 [Actinoplanes lutulentus]